jgi:hypothetical protein
MAGGKGKYDEEDHFIEEPAHSYATEVRDLFGASIVTELRAEHRDCDVIRAKAAKRYSGLGHCNQMIRRLPVLVVLSLAAIGSSASPWLAHSANQEQSTQDHIDWVTQTLVKIPPIVTEGTERMAKRPKPVARCTHCGGTVVKRKQRNAMVASRANVC